MQSIELKVSQVTLSLSDAKAAELTPDELVVKFKDIFKEKIDNYNEVLPLALKTFQKIQQLNDKKVYSITKTIGKIFPSLDNSNKKLAQDFLFSIYKEKFDSTLSLSEDKKNFAKLQSLTLFRCDFENIELDNFKNLQILNISHCKLKMCKFKFKNLQSLNISHCKLKKCKFKYKNLQTLIISHCKLKKCKFMQSHMTAKALIFMIVRI